jgi:hypothetical protein
MSANMINVCVVQGMGGLRIMGEVQIQDAELCQLKQKVPHTHLRKYPCVRERERGSEIKCLALH